MKGVNSKLLSDFLIQTPGSDLRIPENLIFIDDDMHLSYLIGSFASRNNTKIFFYSKNIKSINSLEAL